MINDVTEDFVDEYIQVVHRVIMSFVYCIQYSHDAAHLDMEEMRQKATGEWLTPTRAFYIHCCTYLSEIVRRIYYWQLYRTQKLDMPEDPRLYVAHIKKWIRELKLPPETLESLYQDQASTEGFTFPGDETIFRYRFPEKVISRQDVLQFLRPHMFQRSDAAQVEPAVILGKCYEEYAARLFTLLCINEKLSVMYKDSGWFNNCVIDNDGIELSVYRLEDRRSPCILQVFGSFWLYNDHKVYVTDDIYEVIAGWFILLKHEYDNCFFSYYFGAISREILRHEEGQQQQQHAQEEEDFVLL